MMGKAKRGAVDLGGWCVMCMRVGQTHVCWVSVNLLFVLLEGAVYFHSAVHSADLQKVALLCQQPTFEGGCSRLSR